MKKKEKTTEEKLMVHEIKIEGNNIALIEMGDYFYFFDNTTGKCTMEKWHRDYPEQSEIEINC